MLIWVYQICQLYLLLNRTTLYNHCYRMNPQFTPQSNANTQSFTLSLESGIDNNNNYALVDYSLMTEAEREAEFRRQHQEYITEKMARKKEVLKARKEEFGSSSSDESDDDDPIASESDEQVQNGPMKVNEHKHQHKPRESSQSAKREEEPIEQIPVNSLRKGGEWLKDVLVFQGQTLSIMDTCYPINSFMKIKIINEITQGYPFRIKITCDSFEFLFSPVFAANEQKNGLLINYYTFARIIEQRLQLNGVSLRQAKQERIPSVPETLVYNAYIYGKLNKKSQVLGKWEQRFIVINKEGLYSYKRFNEKFTMFIANGTIKEMWTRFEIHEELLVIKIMHNKRKTQFGIPLTYLLKKNCWLYHFFGVMNNNAHHQNSPKK